MSWQKENFGGLQLDESATAPYLLENKPCTRKARTEGHIMTYRRIVRIVAGGMLLVYGVTLAGDYVLLSQSPHHEQRADSFGLLATSTASDSGFMAVQDAISGEEIQLPPRPGVRIVKIT